MTDHHETFEHLWRATTKYNMYQKQIEIACWMVMHKEMLDNTLIKEIYRQS